MKRDPLFLTVEAPAAGARLDAYLRERLDGVSRGTIQRLIESGSIRVNDRHAKVTQVPRPGDRIEVRWPDVRPAEARAEAILLEVLYEDEHLLVINKPPDRVVHPAAGHEEGTLVNALLHHCAGQLSGIGGVARPGIVHRLDKDTSGCLVVAKNDAAHLALAAQFAGRQLGKVYQVIVCGRMETDCGEIRAAIARHPNHRKRMAVTSGGRDAWTSFRVLKRFAGATWVEAALHTGRTHQIRVHMHHVGHPVVGDAIYGRRLNGRLAEASGYTAPRQLLHAWRLVFSHPEDGRRIGIEAPLPMDFIEGLRVLGGMSAAEIAACLDAGRLRKEGG
ncbi:MAG: RluA family pseudouridine synthase [Verrucomicrobiae bacterium]|nr:RluA family pseudouridine synthase [Verrucomicrobiae bacterium]